MPTPKRTAAARSASGAATDEGAGMRSPRRGRRRGPGREAPSHESVGEEAGDKRSEPQDVTSSSTDAKGLICSKRSRPQQTEKPPSRLPKEAYSSTPLW